MAYLSRHDHFPSLFFLCCVCCGTSRALFCSVPSMMVFIGRMSPSEGGVCKSFEGRRAFDRRGCAEVCHVMRSVPPGSLQGTRSRQAVLDDTRVLSYLLGDCVQRRTSKRAANAYGGLAEQVVQNRECFSLVTKLVWGHTAYTRDGSMVLSSRLVAWRQGSE